MESGVKTPPLLLENMGKFRVGRWPAPPTKFSFPLRVIKGGCFYFSIPPLLLRWGGRGERRNCYPLFLPGGTREKASRDTKFTAQYERKFCCINLKRAEMYPYSAYFEQLKHQQHMLSPPIQLTVSSPLFFLISWPELFPESRFHLVQLPSTPPFRTLFLFYTAQQQSESPSGFFMNLGGKNQGREVARGKSNTIKATKKGGKKSFLFLSWKKVGGGRN